MDKILLDILACPLCKGKVEYRHAQQEIICKFDKLAYPVRHGIPVMLVEEAQKLKEEEKHGL